MWGGDLLLLAFGVAFFGIIIMPLCKSQKTAIWLSLALSAIASGCGIIGAAWFLAGHAPVVLNVTYLAPFGVLKLVPDKLSALFVLISSLVWLPVTLFSFGYLEKFRGHRDLRSFGALYNLLYLAVLFTVLAADLAGFLIAWEMMALSCYFLVNYEYSKPRVTRAGLVMLVMSEIGTLLIIAAFILLYNHSGYLDFKDIRLVLPALPDGVRNVIFVLTLIGFGVKAGLVPVHVWLPLAHPAAPGNISALLSGIILNMGIYGIMRVIVDLSGAGPYWWGLTMVVAGAATAFLGILYALMEQDIKRMLAYSSVENMGIIVLGLGAAMVFHAFRQDTLAALGAVTALYHTLNHSVYKALLFLGASTVDYRTNGVLNMNRLGGLIKAMPYTSLFFLVGALSISAMPPFNGFVSEWLTLQTLLLSLHLPVTMPKVVMAGGGVLLALTAALAITCFVKVCGITFLGKARSESAAQATEASFSMRLGMGLLAAGCLALGVLPTLVIPVLDNAAALLVGAGAAQAMVPAVFAAPEKFSDLVTLGGNILHSVIPAQGAVVVPTDPGFSSIAPTYLIIAIPLAMLFGVLLARLLGGKTKVAKAPVWAGGITDFSPWCQYSATAYSNPVLVLFGSIYGPEINMVKRYFAEDSFHLTTKYERRITPFIERYFYEPLISIVDKFSLLLRWVQAGRVNQYLAYILVTLILTLILVGY